MGYGVGNRETSVSDNISPLGYDYKGNVVSRMTLDGTKTFQYGWDAYDRLISAVQGVTTQTTNVYYDYDTMGRLLRRTKPSGTTAETTINYWLGLNKIAEERVVEGTGVAAHQPDSEQGADPTANGWGFYTQSGTTTIGYADDSARGKVLTATTTASATPIIGDHGGNYYNPNSGPWGATGRDRLGFWYKHSNSASLHFNVYCRVSSGLGTLAFMTGTGTDYATTWGYVYYLGEEYPGLDDGKWHYIELDLGALQKKFSGVSGAITHVDGALFYVNGSQIWLDDIRVFKKTGPIEIFRPDDEVESTPDYNGWFSTYGAASYVTDSVRGKVARLQGEGGSVIIGDDWNESMNSNDDKFNDSARKHLGLWVKNADAGHTPFQIQVYAVTAHYSNIVLNLVADAGTDGGYTKYLGTAVNDGAWHYVEVDLGAFVAAQESGDTLTTIHGLNFTCYANDLYVDDIILSGGELERELSINTGDFSVGLGVQTGAAGAKDINTQSQCVSAWGKYYYQWSDLGTVIAITDNNGSALGEYEPDFYGNYRYETGYRPDTMGITGKYHDLDSDIIGYNKRWYVCDRGVWLSEEPSREDGPNLYHFNYSDGINNIDEDGLGSFSFKNKNNSNGSQCPQGKVPIWRCNRPFAGANYKAGPLSHSYWCCEGPNKTCYGMQSNTKAGNPMPVESDTRGKCKMKCVSPSRYAKSCPKDATNQKYIQPTAEKNYFLVPAVSLWLRGNCHSAARNATSDLYIFY